MTREWGDEAQRLANVLNVQSSPDDDSRMRAFITDQLTALGVIFWESKGNLYAVKGEAARKPCVVAHMDTVHEILPEDEFAVWHDRGHFFGWNRKLKRWEGVGGDDKVGVWIALEALRTFPNLKAAFFRDEESGCLGAQQADHGFFQDCTLVLEADRKGTGEFVRRAAGSNLHGSEFAEACKPILARHGFKEITHGGLTDVSALRDDGLEIASANIACGYYNPHDYREYVVIAEAQAALALVYDIIHTLGDVTWVWRKPKLKERASFVRDPKWSDKRYCDAVVSSVCPVCAGLNAIFFDDGLSEWACSSCRQDLPSLLAAHGPPTRITASVEDRDLVGQVLWFTGMESGVCPHCFDLSLIWRAHERDYSCPKCQKFLTKLCEFESDVIVSLAIYQTMEARYGGSTAHEPADAGRVSTEVRGDESARADSGDGGDGGGGGEGDVQGGVGSGGLRLEHGVGGGEAPSSGAGPDRA